MSLLRPRIELAQGDITGEDVDVIVNAANAELAGGGGVDGAIHRAAGPELPPACAAIRAKLPGHRLATGLSVVTSGFRLRAKHIIHTVGPIYGTANGREAELLASCFSTALALARELGAASIAFPAISTGVYAYPVDEAAKVSLEAIAADLGEHRSPGLVRVLLFSPAALATFEAAASALGLAPH